MTVKHFIGVDVSKADFYVCFNEIDTPKQYPNTQDGINHLIRTMKQRGFVSDNTKIGVESTGPYYYRLSFQCRDNGYVVNIINPLITNGHIKATVRKTKTDKKDAAVIRHVLTQGHGYPFAETKETLILKNLVRTRFYLSKMKRNIQKRVIDNTYKEQIICTNITNMNHIVFAELTHKIKELDKELRQYSKQDQQLLQTIPGLGPTTSAAFIAEITSINRFPTHKQFTAFLGLDPKTHQSGTSINGKGYITKRGNTILRTLIFNCTSVAIQRPNMFQNYYQDKVSKGRPKMVALIATMHKMTRVVYTVWRKQIPYNEQI